MPTILYTCPTCGGELVYDPQKGCFACRSCGSSYTKAQVDEMSAQTAPAEGTPSDAGPSQAAEGVREGAGVVYKCPSCGAEIVTDSDTAATFCYYCHSPVVLSGRLSDQWLPDQVLPFTIDRQQAVDRFIAWTRNKKFIPKNYFAPGQIDKLCGVYYPFWIADFEGTGYFNGTGTIVSRRETSTQVITSTAYYDVSRVGQFTFRDILRNALSKADFQLTNGIQPYQLQNLKPFSMPYLSGFLAEKRDIESSDTVKGIEQEVGGHLEPMLTSGARYSTLSGRTDAQFTNEKFRYALLPAWVLTYRGRDNKMYTYAMNGQTGAVCGRLPLDRGKLLLACLGIAAGIAALLCLGGAFLW